MSDNQVALSQGNSFRLKSSVSETMFENPVVETDVQRHFNRTDYRPVMSVTMHNMFTYVASSSVGGGIGGLILGLTVLPDLFAVSLVGAALLTGSGGFLLAKKINARFKSQRLFHTQKTQELRSLTEKALRRWLFVGFDIIPEADQRWEKLVTILMNHSWREHPSRLQFNTTMGLKGELSASNQYKEDEPTYWTLYEVDNPHKKPGEAKRTQVWSGRTRKSYENVMDKIHKLTYQDLSPEDEHVLERAIKEAQEITDLLVSLNTVGTVSIEEETVVVEAFAGLEEELDELLHQEGSTIKKNLRQAGQFIADRKAERSQKKGFVLQPSLENAVDSKAVKKSVLRFRKK